MNNKLELRNKIYNGTKTAIKKLIETRAKENDSLIVSKDGKIIRIAAKKIKQN